MALSPFTVGRSLIGRFLGNTISEAAAFAAGVALGPVLGPPTQELRNTVNAKYPFVPVEPGDAAEIVAEDVEQLGWGRHEAAAHGLNNDNFDALVGAVLNAPGVPELLSLWRRGKIDAAGFVHGLRKARLETRWDGPLEALKDVLLTPAELANARQQGYIDQARQYDEAAKSGIDGERAEIQYLSVGLPPGHSEASELLNRGLIDSAEFAQMIREGHTKTKYTAVLERAAQYVLTPINYVEGRLRGWIDDGAMYAGTGLRGVSKADTDLLFKIHGRPLSWHQIWIGLRRGGKYDGPTTGIDPAFLSGLRQSDIRPEWYNLAWSQRYAYPTAFVLRSLTESGDITEQEAHDILLFQGWEPALAAKVSAKWATPKAGAAKVDPIVAKAESKLFAVAQKAYTEKGITKAEATTALDHLTKDAAVQAKVFEMWDAAVVVLFATPPPAPGP